MKKLSNFIYDEYFIKLEIKYQKYEMEITRKIRGKITDPLWIGLISNLYHRISVSSSYSCWNNSPKVK